VYTYNGLNWRTTKHTIGGVGGSSSEVLADNATPVLREKRRIRGQNKPRGDGLKRRPGLKAKPPTP
jgi:hypothetical protein